MRSLGRQRTTSVSKIATSYQVVIERERRKQPRDEDASDAGSQRHILSNDRLEIFKEREFEVRIDTPDPKGFVGRGDPVV